MSKLVPGSINIVNGADSQVDYAGRGGFGTGPSPWHLYPNLFGAPAPLPGGYSFVDNFIGGGATRESFFFDVSGFERVNFAGVYSNPNGPDIGFGVQVTLQFFVDPLFVVPLMSFLVYQLVNGLAAGTLPYTLQIGYPGGFPLPTPYFQVKAVNTEIGDASFSMAMRAFNGGSGI